MRSMLVFDSVMAARMIAPTIILKAKGETPIRFSPFWVMETSSTPRMQPSTLPLPPPSLAPPSTTAASTSSSRP